jgi:hypothetical protein
MRGAAMSESEPSEISIDTVEALARVFAFSYEAVDAAVAAFLETLVIYLADGTQLRPESQWARLSAGSSRHRVTVVGNRQIAEIVVRAIVSDPMQPATSLLVGGSDEPPGESRARNLRIILDAIEKTIATDRENLEELKAKGIYEPPHPARNALEPAVSLGPKPPGRRRSPANERARQRIAAGDDRAQVYRDWLIDNGHNPESPSVRSRWRDAFRKAITRQLDGRTK